MTDNDIYSQNLDAAVRRSAGVKPTKAKSSREAVLRLKRDRRKAREEGDSQTDNLLDLDDERLELSEEELREYAAFLEDSDDDDFKPQQNQTAHTLGMNGAESLGGAYTNERTATGSASRTDKKEVSDLLKKAGHDLHHAEENETDAAAETEVARADKKRREWVAKLFVSALVIAMMAAAFWPQ